MKAIVHTEHSSAEWAFDAVFVDARSRYVYWSMDDRWGVEFIYYCYGWENWENRHLVGIFWEECFCMVIDLFYQRELTSNAVDWIHIRLTAFTKTYEKLISDEFEMSFDIL